MLLEELASDECVVDWVVVLGDLGLNGRGLAFGSFLGLKPDAGIGVDISSNSMLAKMSSIRLFSVVEVVVVGLNPGGKNFEISSCWIVSKTALGLLFGGPWGLKPFGNNEESRASSIGILAKINWEKLSSVKYVMYLKYEMYLYSL